MADAEQRLLEHWEQQDAGAAPRDDPVRQLIRHVVIPDNADPQLWLLGLGEKVAALGGHLEVTAVFHDAGLTLIREPGADGQPPILPDPGAAIDEEIEADREPIDPDAPQHVALTDDERDLILAALTEWGGVARPTEVLAWAIGFSSVEAFDADLERLEDTIRDAQPLAPVDWKRVLISTEICFASDYYGAGWEWESLTGLDNYASLRTLRDLQEKLIEIANAADPPDGDLASPGDFPEPE